MRHVLSFTGSAMLSVALAAPAGADEVFLKEAGVLSGRVVSRTPAAIAIELGAGTVTIPADRVERIDEGPSLLDEYDDRVEALAARDRAGWLALARWAGSHGLPSQARAAYEHVRTIAPDNPEANRALGYVEVNGRWMTEADGYRARGYVPFEGRWMTVEARQDILERRADREELTTLLAATVALVREAETNDAGSRSPEARDCHASTLSALSAIPGEDRVHGIPLWWVWGPGPVVWPSGPVVGSHSRTPACR